MAAGLSLLLKLLWR